MKLTIDQIFNKIINIVFCFILLGLAFAIAIGTFKLFAQIYMGIVSPQISLNYVELITGVLTLFVMVELSKSLVDYFKEHRLRMTFIVDAAIVFFIREMMIQAFQHKVDPPMIYAISFLLLVLTILRVSSIMMFQREVRMVSKMPDKD